MDTKFESGTSFGICVVVAVGSALVVLVLGAVGGALEFPLVFLSGDVENPFRDIYFQCLVFKEIGKIPWQKTVP